MTDYKELIERLRNAGGGDLGIKMCHEAADAIEQLVNDRNASVDALKAIEDAFCSYGERKSGAKMDEVSE